MTILESLPLNRPAFCLDQGIMTDKWRFVFCFCFCFFSSLFETLGRNVWLPELCNIFFFYGFCCFTSPERKTLLPGVVLVDCPEALKLEKMRTSELCYSCFKEKDFLKLSFRTEPELSTVGKLVRHGRTAHRGKDGAPWERWRTAGMHWTESEVGVFQWRRGVIHKDFY